MRYLFLAVILVCAPMQTSALVIEPQKEPAASTKPVKQKAVSTPTKAMLAPPSKATLGFYQAAASANYDMMDLYLQQGADINCRNCDSKGNTPLLNALPEYRSTAQCIRWLVEHGADVNIANADGITPLMLGVPLSFNGYGSDKAQIINLLLDKGAITTAQDIKGNTPLAYLPKPIVNEYNQGLKRAFSLPLISLLEHGANINAADHQGETALMDAAKECSEYSVETLLANKADPTIKNKLGQTALDIAIEKATRSGQNSYCNNTVKILQNPQQAQQVSSVRSNSQASPNNGTPSSTPPNTVISAYAGNYSGNYSGGDNGPFQVTVEQDGNIKLIGKSLRNNQAFTGNGKMNSDGSLGISLGSISTGASFQGSINPKTGALYGTWKNAEQAGNFSGSKQSAQAQASNPIEAIGGLLNVLNKALAK